MDEFDFTDSLAQPDRAGMLVRAAQWRTRIASVPDLTSGLATPPSGSNHPHLHLPPECVQLGELARSLSAPDLPLRPTIVPSRVNLGQHPQAWLLWDSNSPPDESHDLAKLQRADAQDDTVRLTHLCHGALHPTQVLLNLYLLIHQLNGRSASSPTSAHLVMLDRLCPSAPTAENPAKQLALVLHERIPLFWGSDAAALIARDWMMRQLWYAERQAWSAGADEVAMLHIMARLPRYLPNTTTWVQVESADKHEPLVTSLGQIALRRRLPLQTVELPAGLMPLEATIYLLEFGEWLALYAAQLNNVDPDERVPHQILF